MKRAIIITMVLAFLLLSPACAFAHHVGMAEDSMPADQWFYVDSVAHGVSSDGSADMVIAPGAEAANESMTGDNSWVVSGNANMNAE